MQITTLSDDYARALLCWLVRGADGATRANVLSMQGEGVWEQLSRHPWFAVTLSGRLTWSKLGKKVLDAMPNGGQRAPRPAGVAR